jgi:hypothetical protein
MIADPFDSLVTQVDDATIDPMLWAVYFEKLRTILGCEYATVVSVHKQTLAIMPLHRTQWDERAMHEPMTRQLARVGATQLVRIFHRGRVLPSTNRIWLCKMISPLKRAGKTRPR